MIWGWYGNLWLLRVQGFTVNGWAHFLFIVTGSLEERGSTCSRVTMVTYLLDYLNLKLIDNPHDKPTISTACMYTMNKLTSPNDNKYSFVTTCVFFNHCLDSFMRCKLLKHRWHKFKSKQIYFDIIAFIR